MRSLIFFMSLLMLSFSAFGEETGCTRDCNTVSVPEPASLGLLAGGVIALAAAGKRYKKDCG